MIRFISDLHLSPDTPRLLGLFDHLLRQSRLARQQGKAQQLYILGDLFDTWIGDDDGSPSNPEATPCHVNVVRSLRTTTLAGVEIFLLHGNRDFLLGEHFAAITGVRLLPDPYVLNTSQWQYALTHGDSLCTGDTAYQAFRKQARDPQWQHKFLAHPIQERRNIAEQIRAQSESNKLKKRTQQASNPANDIDIMDVHPGATEDFLRTHGYATLIHGHTHRPAKHQHIVDGILTERLVLADWRENEAYGECLCLLDGVFTRQPWQA